MLEIVILAAGKGTRMCSDLPKVLHPLAGRPLLEHVLQTAKSLKPAKIHVVIGHQAERVKTTIADSPIGQSLADTLNWVEQLEQKGTGDAVKQALPVIDPAATVLIMNGDVPLIEASTLEPLCEPTQGIRLLTVKLDDPSGLGRIDRDKKTKAVLAIVEDKDATKKQKKIREISTGLMAMSAANLSNWLGRITPKNAQNEYYLGDLIGLAVVEKQSIHTSKARDSVAVSGVNSRAELAQLERAYQMRAANTWMSRGVHFHDPARVDMRGDVELGKDVSLDVNVVLEGNCRIGAGVTIGPNVLIRDCQIGAGCVIEANSVLESSVVADECVIGPFARLRPETHLANGAKVGNFVEVKKSTVGVGSKINHLSYVGDSIVGNNVNIGAGVITCNYDGANKHQTAIGDDVFVGSDCQLVAPVTVGKGATIGAGSTISKDVPADSLALSRSPQRSIKNWQRPKKA